MENQLGCCCDKEHLTEREVDVLVLAATGLPNPAIGRLLHLSADTVAHHLTSMFRRTDAQSRAELVARAYAVGILETSCWPPRCSGRRCLGELPRHSNRERLRHADAHHP
ncbi:response regulator transcription factor [Kribbella sancticallisti]